MMSKFIEVHFPIEDKVFFNVEDILCFFTRDDDTIIRAKDGNCYAVTEFYDEVKALIKDAGVLIHKPDPRLNLTTPLTMDDLREMIGEPIWNSNNGKWYLMLKVREDLDPELAVVQDSDAKIEVFSPEELIKFPLYRMNQEVK